LGNNDSADAHSIELQLECVGAYRKRLTSKVAKIKEHCTEWFKNLRRFALLNKACTDQRVKLSEFEPDTAEHETVLMHCPVNVMPFTMAFNTSFPLFTLVPSIETPIM